MTLASDVESGPPSTSPQLGFSLRLVMPQSAICWAKICSCGFAENVSGSAMRDFRGGSRDDGSFLVPTFQSAMFWGASRNSIHFQAASGFLLCEKIASEFPAIVV